MANNNTTTAQVSKTLVRFTLVNKQSGAQAPCWIKTVSFKDGPGLRVNKMATTRVRDEAARFTTATAIEIAMQFSQSPACLELATGQQLEQETRDLQAAQHAKHVSVRQARAEVQAEFNKALREVMSTDDMRRLHQLAFGR